MLLNHSNNCQRLHPLLESIASQIRLRRSILCDLVPLEEDSEFTNLKGELNGEDFFINNEIHRARGLRRIHLESAKLGTGLEILHCVFFPIPTFDLPIFGVDVVVFQKGITAAIVDLSPVSKDLPLEIRNGLANISIPNFRKVRQLPEWGNIFSQHVQFVRPEGKEEEDYFLQIVDDFLRILVNFILHLEPDMPDAGSTIERLKFQQFYCLQQKRNDKTRNVLAKAFDPHWAEQYIETFLFEVPFNL